MYTGLFLTILGSFRHLIHTGKHAQCSKPGPLFLTSPAGAALETLLGSSPNVKCQISTSVFGFDVGLPRLRVKVRAPIIHLWPQLASPGGGALSLMSLRVVYAVSGRNLMDSLEFLPNHSQASLPLSMWGCR